MHLYGDPIGPIRKKKPKHFMLLFHICKRAFCINVWVGQGRGGKGRRAGENKLETELVLFSFMGCYWYPILRIYMGLKLNVDLYPGSVMDVMTG